MKSYGCILCGRLILTENVMCNDCKKAYEQGKADGEREMWEQMRLECANHSIELNYSCRGRVSYNCDYETCPIAEGGK